ncbi:SNF1-related protein kinase regulatory subunit beta-2-like isoform X1 [Senna tora]|uniref:SNF1-related protein kinase regulatory subunit beta-2-like isoform X1 n=1 Tax=Senna tora TaxID=362788 RepID=A0A834WVP9_9FABA|nr:SNF1-related protein kinase regulatory subunit beta-2-like isoform X1 [Senna tora]
MPLCGNVHENPDLLSKLLYMNKEIYPTRFFLSVLEFFVDVIMGSNSREGEGCSGVKKLDDGNDGFSDPTAQLPPRGPQASQPLQVPVMALPRGEGELVQNGYIESMLHVKLKTVKISWNHSGKTVAIVGSWDNWETTEFLQIVGENFVITKTIPVGIYHYRFIVDGYFTYAPELPWASDHSGYAYNILDLQDYIPEKVVKLSDFESPPSPPWSYDNIFLNDDEFGKAPPELPPQIPVTTRDEPSSSTDSHHTFPRPTHLELNHLYIHKAEREPFVALRSTHRFQHKYVTMVLYKSLRREG